MYNVLSPSLKVLGSLTLDNGPGSTAFWADSINQQIADDGATTDPNSLIQMTQNAVDLNANHKLWNHTVSVSFDNSTLGKQVESGYYLTYVSPNNGRTYLITLYSVKEDTAGATKIRTAQGSNSAIYELGKIYPAAKNFTQASLKDVVTYLSSYIGWSLVVPDDASYQIPYVIDGKTSAMAIVQDLLVKFDVEADAYINLNRSGQIYKRIIEFGSLGENTGELIRYGSPAKGFESISQEFVSDTLFTKLHIKGVNDSTPADVNQGNDWVVDDEANKRYNPVGASYATPTYLEGTITNSVLSEPKALLDWGKAQLKVFNHPRINYTVTAMHDIKAGLGDFVGVQDYTASPPILINGRVMQTTTSFADPQTNSITLGEFTSLIANQNGLSAKVDGLDKKVESVDEKAITALKQIQDASDESTVLGRAIATKVQASLKDAQDYADGITKDSTNAINAAANAANSALNASNKASQDLDNYKTANSTAMQNQETLIDQISADGKTVKSILSDGNGNWYQDLNSALSKQTIMVNAQGDISKAQQTAQNASFVATNTQGQVANLTTSYNNITATVKNKADISYVDQKAGSITSTVTKYTDNAVNGLSYDNRNLLTNTAKDISVTSHTTDYYPQWVNINTGFSFENGKTYTFSSEASNSSDKVAEASIRVFEPSTNTQVGIYAFPADGKRHSVTFAIPNDSHNYNLLLYAGHANIIPGVDVTTTYHHPKLELGSIATPWTQAPEDIDNAISQVTQTANQISATVGSKANSSDLTVLKNQIGATVISNGVVNAINLDTSGALIRADKIILDGNVTVTQDFYAKGGYFTNLNASNMNTGILDASKVHVANLDAGSITSGRLNTKLLTISSDSTDSLQMTLRNNGLHIEGHVPGAYFDNRLDINGLSLTFPGANAGTWGQDTFARAGGVQAISLDPNQSMFNTSVVLYGDKTGGGHSAALGIKNPDGVIHRSFVVTDGAGLPDYANQGAGLYAFDQLVLTAGLTLKGTAGASIQGGLAVGGLLSTKSDMYVGGGFKTGVFGSSPATLSFQSVTWGSTPKPAIVNSNGTGIVIGDHSVAIVRDWVVGNAITI